MAGHSDQLRSSLSSDWLGLTNGPRPRLCLHQSPSVGLLQQPLCKKLSPRTRWRLLRFYLKVRKTTHSLSSATQVFRGVDVAWTHQSDSQLEKQSCSTRPKTKSSLPSLRMDSSLLIMWSCWFPSSVTCWSVALKSLMVISSQPCRSQFSKQLDLIDSRSRLVISVTPKTLRRN